MKNTTPNRLEIWPICLLLGLTAGFCIQTAQAEDEAELVRLELIPNKVEFKIGEPISVQVKLINLTGAPLEISGQFDFDGSLTIRYKHQNDRKFGIYSSAYIVDYIRTEPLPMVPVEGLTFKVILAHDSMKRSKPYTLFDRAGNYIFKVSFWPFKGKQLWTDEVIVSVTEPTGVDALALERWMDEDVLWAIQYGDGEIYDFDYDVKDGDIGVEKLKALVAEYPDSIYGQHAQRGLMRIGIKMEGEPQIQQPVVQAATSEPEPESVEKPPQPEQEAAPLPQPPEQVAEPTPQPKNPWWYALGIFLLIAIGASLFRKYKRRA